LASLFKSSDLLACEANAFCKHEKFSCRLQFHKWFGYPPTRVKYILCKIQTWAKIAKSEIQNTKYKLRIWDFGCAKMKLGLDLDVFQVLDQLGNLAGGYSIPLVHQFSGYRVPNPKIAVLVLLPEIGT